MKKVYCILNGEGFVESETDDTIKVVFLKGTDEEFSKYYTKDGYLKLANGEKSAKRMLFEKEPKIIVDNAFMDNSGKIIEDKDFIVYGKTDDFRFNAGFFDAKNMSVFTKSGFRDSTGIFKQINPELFIYKIENEFISKVADKLKEEIIEEPKQEPQNKAELNIPEQKEYIEKEATKEEENEEFRELVVRDGRVLKVKGQGIKQEDDKALIFNNYDKKVSVEIEKNVGFGSVAFAVLSFIPSKVYQIIKVGSNNNIKDYINIFDAYLIVSKSGKEKEQKNLSSSNVVFEIKDGILLADFK